jgi:N6-L-threonylcarbamoyladenine synthase
MLILGIESSCDDTAAAVVEDGEIVHASVLSSQDLTHRPFGGVVPELASRKHLESVYPVVTAALSQARITLDDIGLIAVTQGPGLIGSLLVGYSFAKAISMVRAIPFRGVDHMAGHILSVYLEKEKPAFPYIALIASGGTTSLYLAEGYTSFSLLGRTRDDAAGEAFDKVAKLLGLSYPGGPVVAKLADTWDSDLIDFPRAWLDENSLDFSFSGLKTAVLNYCNQQRQRNLPLQLAQICASFQEAVVDVLAEKTLAAARRYNVTTVVLGGGVSANSRLRKVFTERARANRLNSFIPRPQFSTDNAAMIAFAGYYAYKQNGASSIDEDVYSRSQLG